jgi:hypothetical protein
MAVDFGSERSDRKAYNARVPKILTSKCEMQWWKNRIHLRVYGKNKVSWWLPRIGSVQFFGSVNHRKDFVATEAMRRRVEILNSGEAEGTRYILLL